MPLRDQEKTKQLEAYFSWEGTKKTGAGIKAFFRLCSLILFNPALFFKVLASLDQSGLRNRLIKAFVFALILGYLKLFLDVINIHWFEYLAKNFLSTAERSQAIFLSSGIIHSPFFIFRPLINFILIFVLLAVSIKLIFGFDKKLYPLFLIMCYKSAAEIFYLLPLVGGIIALVWSLFLLIVGLKTFYQADTFRVFFAGVVMPFLLALFIVMTAGSSFYQFISVVYPETKPQMMKLNEANAYVSMQHIVSAASQYKKELGFYPVRLGVLDKYLDRAAAEEFDAEGGINGYLYQYHKIDEDHFTIMARPLEFNVTGRVILYADQDGGIHLNDSKGRLIQGTKELQGINS